MVWIEKRGACRDVLGIAVLELKQLFIITERGEGVDRCFNGDKLNDDITNQVGTEPGGRTIHTGRYLENARKGALLQQGVMAGYIVANGF